MAIKVPPGLSVKARSVSPPQPEPKRGPGRPKGSKNRPKEPIVAHEPAPQAPRFMTALTAAVNDASDEIARTAQVVAKVRRAESNARTIAQIINGVALDPEDWRATYHGKLARIYASDFNGKKHFFDRSETRRVLLAVPRDTDVGGEGAQARAVGMIAGHYAASEDGGTYYGAPVYYTREELKEGLA